MHLVDAHDVELLVEGGVQGRDLRRRELAAAARGDAGVAHVPLRLVDAVPARRVNCSGGSVEEWARLLPDFIGRARRRATPRMRCERHA